MPARIIPEKFAVAFSCAGEQRALVRTIALSVEAVIGLGSVFFDEWFEHYIAGDDADLVLQDIYGKRSELVVVCISSRYGGKSWTRSEHRAIRARQMELGSAFDDRVRYRMLPIRVGDGDIAGVLFNTIAPDVRSRRPEDAASLIVERLRLVRGSLGEADPLSAYRESLRRRAVQHDWWSHPIPLSVSAGPGGNMPAREAIWHWFEHGPQHCIVLGDPGAGKTGLLWWFAEQAVARDAVVPIVVAAAKLRGRTSNLADVTSCAEPALIEIQSEVPLTKQMILILDGLDELVGTLTGGEKVAGQVLATVFRHIPVTARVIAACRELVFSSIEQAFTSALPEAAEIPSGSNDVYDLAIGRALADRQPLRVMRVQPVLRRDAEDFLAHKNLSGNLIHAAAMNASLEPLLRHPFTVRLLTLSLPKLASRGGDIALSEVYRAYVTAALLREDRTLRPGDLDAVFDACCLVALHPRQGKHERFANLAARAGLLVLTGTTWRFRHYSLWEYFFAVAVRRQLQQYDSKMLSQLDLVNGYNINRMLVPMLTGVDSQHEIRGPARVVTSEEYEQFLENTGWRRASGYGIHPSTSNAREWYSVGDIQG